MTRRYSKRTIEQAAQICAIRADELRRAWEPHSIHWPANVSAIAADIGAGIDAICLARDMELAVHWRFDRDIFASPADKFDDAAAWLLSGWLPHDLPPMGGGR